MGFQSALLPPIRGMIRRFHGTKKDFAPQILEEGLKVNPPQFNVGEAIKRLHPDDYDAIYTTVQPRLGYFDPTYDNNALVVLDIPKDWYSQAKRLPYNPEWPDPTPKSEWDEQFRMDEMFDDIKDLFKNVIPVQQGGRVDIFKQDIPREFINEIIIPRGDDTFKTLVKPNRNLDWWNIDFGMDL